MTKKEIYIKKYIEQHYLMFAISTCFNNSWYNIISHIYYFIEIIKEGNKNDEISNDIGTIQDSLTNFNNIR